jgi:hypothetical protein
MYRKQLVILLIISAVAIVISCKHEIPTQLVPPGQEGVCFESDILPIFQNYCAKSGCHDVATASDEYTLDSYSHIVAKGLTPGNAANSKIYEVLTENGDDRMPKSPNDPLAAAQISLIAQWINEGARNTAGCAPVCDSSSFTYSGNVKPILQTHCLGCHSGAAIDGGFVPLDTYDGLKEVVNAGLLLPAIERTGPFEMPKNGAKISDCKITIIRKWIEAGALNN